MNIVFFGSSNFAVAPLKALLALASTYKVSCVVTQPDKQKGRGLHFAGPIIKTVALESGLEIYQPDNVNNADSVKFLNGLNPDLFIVIAYGQILSQKILDIPKIIAINLHASLLPKLRGASPINWAIINGEKITGITAIKMTDRMDAGPIILQKEINIYDDDTALTLEDKLSDLAGTALLTAVSSVEANNYNLTPQDLKNASFAPKLKKKDGLIDWGKAAPEVHNLIRGCLGWPGAFTYYNGKLLKIYKAEISSKVNEFASYKAGEIVNISREGIIVAAGVGNLIIEELQLEGKRRMKVEEFISGHKIRIGEKLEIKNS